MWLIELGYSSDTRYMDKGTEKKGQHAELSRLIAAEGYDVMLLPVVLGSAGTLFKFLDRATKEMDIPNARRKKLYSKLQLHCVYCLPCVPTAIPGKTKANCRSKGKNKRQIASLPTHSVHRGRPVNRPTPSRPPAFIFILID
jgi:hypothetical protein